MTIQILDIPEGQKLARITVDFDNGVPQVFTQYSNNPKQEESGTAIDFSTLGDVSVSQEVVEKPEIPDHKERKIKVSPSMQGLTI